MKILVLNDDIIEGVIDIARQASAAILDVYYTDFNISFKDDKSPLTEADTLANKIITDGLEKIAPGVPILSEEGQKIPYDKRSKWETYWLVDPLDGTKEFIKKNDEFTINIALIEYNQPILGVVYAPALDRLYWGSREHGSFKLNSGGISTSISVKSQITTPVQIAVSRSHLSPKVKTFISQFIEYNLHPMGSSLKICCVSDGTMHLYPRLGPTMEWDTAASHAIIRGAGGEIIKVGTNDPIEYNKKDLLNPDFIAGNILSVKSLEFIE